jgi:hypothetical protein
LDSVDRETEIDLPEGGEFRIVKEPEPGVSLRLTPSTDGIEGPTSTIWEASAERPTGYPVELPFLPDRVSAVTAGPENAYFSVHWHKLEEASEVVSQLIAESVAEGWERLDPTPFPTAAPLQVDRLERGNRERVLMATTLRSEGLVMLIESEAKSQG